ncbi:MAG: antibiotic biosynthesis monooxygenase [Acidobacteriota bacterium]
MAIKRIWHGWTTPQRAGDYLDVLRGQVIPGIEAKQIPGYRGLELLRRDHPDEVEFITIMHFDSLESVMAFQGEDYARSHVPAVARAVLSRWDERAQHYEVLGTAKG